jgi:hypothetical protein
VEEGLKHCNNENAKLLEIIKQLRIEKETMETELGTVTAQK